MRMDALGSDSAFARKSAAPAFGFRVSDLLARNLEQVSRPCPTGQAGGNRRENAVTKNRPLSQDNSGPVSGFRTTNLGHGRLAG